MSVVRFASSNGGRTLSPAVWKEIQIGNIRDGFLEGILYENDFLNADNLTTAEGWVISATTSGTLSLGAAEGGVLKADSAAHASADDGVEAQLLNCRFRAGADRVLVAEARVKVSNVLQQYFFGLAATDSTLMPSGVIDDASDKVGFFRDDGTQVAAGKISAITARAAAEAVEQNVADLVNDTYIKLGFRIEGLDRVRFFVNGVQVAVVETAANVPDAEMCLSLVAKCQSTAADAELEVDWVKIAQQRERA